MPLTDIHVLLHALFELRRQGRIEEAYEAIRSMYAAHKGRYTSPCMFWTASNVLRLRLEQGRTEEADKIYQALQRMLPLVKEVERQLKQERIAKNQPAWKNGTSNSVEGLMQYAANRIAKTVKPADSQLSEVKSEDSTVIDNPKDSSSSSDSCSLNPGQQAVLDCIKSNPGYSVPMISDSTGIPQKTIEHHIAILISKSLIEPRKGELKTVVYYEIK